MDLIALTAVKALIALALGLAAFYSADLLASPFLKNGPRTALGLGFGIAVMVLAMAMMGTVELGAGV